MLDKSKLQQVPWFNISEHLLRNPEINSDLPGINYYKPSALQ